MDSLDRIRSRAEKNRKGRYVRYAPGVCSMSDLTQNAGITVGSAIGQVPEGQPQSTNLVLNTSAPTVAAGFWAQNGGATLTIDPTNVFDGGFAPIVAHGALTTDFLNNNTAVATPANVHTISAYFSVSPQFALANPSPQVGFSVRWTGGVAREDKIIFTPSNGGILSTTAGVTSVHSTQTTVTLPNGQPAVVFRIDFQATPPALSTLGDIRIYPRTDAAGNGDVECGGFQIEMLSAVTAFTPTSQAGTRTRDTGALPPQMIGFILSTFHLNANYQYAQGVDSTCVFCFDTAAKTMTLPDISGTQFSNSGEFCIIQNNNVGNTTIAAGAGVVIMGAGLPVAGVASVTLPLAGTGAQTPNAEVFARFDNTLKAWILFDVGSAGGSGASSFIPPTSVNFAASPYTIANVSTRVERTFLVDTSGGVVTVNLPAAPIDGEIVNVKRTTTDGNQLTVARNAKNIEGAAADFLDANAALSNYSFQFDAASAGWWAI